MKPDQQYELIFALDAVTTLALSEAASRVLAPGIACRPLGICDQYYQRSLARSLSGKGKAPRSQYRVRQFDDCQELHLQKIAWKRDVCSVRQSTVSHNEFLLGESRIDDKNSPGRWFHKKVAKHQLEPNLQIRAELTRWHCGSNEDQAQVTLESNLRVKPIGVQATRVRDTMLSSSILRMSFQTALPASFKRLIYQFSLLSERSTVLLEMAQEHLAEQHQIDEGHITPITQASLPRTEVMACRVG